MSKIISLFLQGLVLLVVILHIYNPALANCGEVTLNEIDYDQPGTDQAEFVELIGPPGADLIGLEIHFINGLNGEIYRNQPLEGFLPTDGFFVLGNASVPNLDLLLGSGGSNLIQNGAPDGVGIWDRDTQSYCDFINYEGAITGFESWSVIEADPADLCETGASDSLSRRNGTVSPTDAWIVCACASPGEPNLGPTAVVTTRFIGRSSYLPIPGSAGLFAISAVFLARGIAQLFREHYNKIKDRSSRAGF